MIKYKFFRSQLFAREDNRYRQIITGSLVERPLFYVLNDPTDIDVFRCLTDIWAVPTYQCTATAFRGTLFIIHTEDLHPGFARLRENVNSQKFYRKAPENPCRRESWYEILKGPSTKRTYLWIRKEKVRLLIDTLSLLSRHGSPKELTIDRVDAIKCPYWPQEAAEWKTRRRNSGWPTTKDIEKIVKSGCHFVAKPHQNNKDDDTQWRFSFSQAELILIDSWTDVQKYIYHILRIIKSEVTKTCGGEDKTVICTYYFKTLMFWTCEEKPKEFWNEDNLKNSISELLCLMIEWLIERCIPNYFIRDNNMIDHLLDENDFSKEILSLLHYNDHCLPLLLSVEQKHYPSIMLSLNVSKRILCYGRIFLSYLDLNWPPEFFRQIVESTDNFPELRHLHDGITKHIQLMRCKSGGESCVENFDTLSQSALHSFNLALEPNDSGSTHISVSMGDPLLAITQKLKPSERFATETTFNFQTAFSKEGGMNQKLFAFDKMRLGFLQKSLEIMLKVFSDILDQPTYFISAAYRANFLYTALHEYTLAYAQCVQVFVYLDRLRKSIQRNFESNIFPLLLSNELSIIFDDEVQAVLGFVTLHHALTVDSYCNRNFSGNRNEKEVVIRLRPADFIAYIRCKCFYKLNQKEDVLLSTKFRQRLHKKADENKNFEKFSKCFLSAALSISSGFKLQ